MNYSAIIEIPKGSNQRIHLSFDGKGFINLGPIKDQIPVNEGVMPVHYGYIENTINPDEKDNVDVIIFSHRKYKTGDQIKIKVIGMIRREDHDHKVIAIDDSIKLQSFNDISEDERHLILKYFGYKSKITAVKSEKEAVDYIDRCSV